MNLSRADITIKDIPLYNELFEVKDTHHDKNSSDDYTAILVAKKAFPKGSKITDIIGHSIREDVTLYSVGIGNNKNIELNSILIFMCHSCDPSVRVDVDNMCLFAIKDIKPGDELTFFYPSTEWEMSRPFDCWCKAENKCLGKIRGAKYIPEELLIKNGWVLNKHIHSQISSAMSKQQ